jgi:hypothetical protein
MRLDRRSATRRQPAADDTLAAVRLRAGGTLAVIDISAAGALVEGATRIRPGTHVEVHVVTVEGRVLVRSRVVRASVVEVTASSVRYRAGLAFEGRVDIDAGRVVATQEPGEEQRQGRSYPHESDDLAPRKEERTC